MNKILEAYDQCENIIKQHSKTFYRAFSLLPKNQKKAVWAVYAFCRRVDDIVDEGTSPSEELRQFEMEFESFLKGFNHNDAMWIALDDVFKNFNMDIEAFRDMIRGQRMDLSDRVYVKMGDVLDYSYHVASTVGLMLLPVLAPGKEEQLRDDGIYLGYAMQITNILRDIGEDLERGRLYIPQDLLVKYEYTVTDLMEHRNNEAFRSIWEEMASLAEDYYEKAFRTLNLYPVYSRTPVKGAALLYRAILGEVRNNHYNVFSEKHNVSKDLKERIISTIS
ncbi:phytoene/squalene synthase family protein [Bacillus sp. BHET2]|uniref:phytoene/squalene synthase family protein n=1 Tax=Bacillus sp. BHET2 TaxID=2583818 RepID=UPI00110D6D31|nr:phytoene/squalene synthase family protein [Bacillus sp. BHET2]TMU88119.1 phytoene/squalene synthase family protein [Bacillus sp. BHET2]